MNNNCSYCNILLTPSRILIPLSFDFHYNNHSFKQMLQIVNLRNEELREIFTLIPQCRIIYATLCTTQKIQPALIHEHILLLSSYAPIELINNHKINIESLISLLHQINNISLGYIGFISRLFEKQIYTYDDIELLLNQNFDLEVKDIVLRELIRSKQLSLTQIYKLIPFIDKVCTHLILKKYQLDPMIIAERLVLFNSSELNKTLSRYQVITIQFINKYQQLIDWYNLSNNTTINIKLISTFKDKIYKTLNVVQIINDNKWKLDAIVVLHGGLPIELSRRIINYL